MQHGPSPPTAPDSEPTGALKFHFWLLVVIFNLGIGLTAVGSLLVIFRGPDRFHLAMVGGGLIILIHGIYRVRSLEERRQQGDF